MTGDKVKKGNMQELTQFLDKIISPTILINKNYNILYTNKAFIELFNKEDITYKKNLKDFVVSFYCENQEKDLLHLKFFNLDLLNGNQKIATRWSISPIHRIDDYQEIYMLTGIILDTKDTPHDYFNVLFNNIQDSVYVYLLEDKNKPGKFLDVNQYACQQLGYLKSEIMEKTMLDIDAMESLGDLLYVHSELAEKGSILFETFHISSSGKKFPVEVNARLHYHHNEPIVFAISRDITERRRFEEELLKSKKKYENLIENSINGIAILQENRFVFANQAAAEIFGMQKELFIGKEIAQFLLSNKNYQKLNETLSAITQETGLSTRFIEDFKKEDGSEIAILMNIAYTIHENMPAVLIFLIDITDIKRSEKEREMLILELEGANRELKELSRLKDDFIAITSHDLRSPFNGILGFSQILLNDSNLTSKQREHVKMIKESAEIQLDYVNSLLDLLTFENKHIRLKLSYVTLGEVINASLNILIPLSEKKNIDIQVDIDRKLVVSIDVPKIVQVLNNLISNAIKFTPSGGSIKIEQTVQENFLFIHIIDNGKGVEPEQIPHLFTRYSPIQSYGTEGEKGSGLGLAICKLLIEAHGGTIGINSEIKKGSDFYFSLPLSKTNLF